MTTPARLGRYGEQLAVRHLQRSGFVVLERNWRATGAGVRGELDIVARDGEVLVFCEVKTRRGEGAGGPLAGVTAHKCAQLRRLAAAYLAASPRHWPLVRFDVVGVSWPDGGGGPVLTHLRQALP